MKKSIFIVLGAAVVFLIFMVIGGSSSTERQCNFCERAETYCTEECRMEQYTWYRDQYAWIRTVFDIIIEQDAIIHVGDDDTGVAKAIRREAIKVHNVYAREYNERLHSSILPFTYFFEWELPWTIDTDGPVYLIDDVIN